MKTAVIIQARMSSTRLPGKVLMKLNGLPVLKRLINRVKQAKKVDQIIIATGFNFANDKLRHWCYHNNIDSYSGPEDNVLERVLLCAQFYRVDRIIEITGDCPLVDPIHIDHLCEVMDSNELQCIDYASNIYPNRTWPDGFDIQVYSTLLLEKMHYSLAPDNPHREHAGWNITNYYSSEINTYCYAAIQPELIRPKWGLTLDTQEDLHLLDCIFTEFDNRDFINFSAQDVIKFLHKNPDLLTINRHIKRKQPTGVNILF